jgi:acyl-CoA thioester hydrolase
MRLARTGRPTASSPVTDHAGEPQVARIPVHRRFSDLDPLGHVNNVVFHDYLQEARVGLLQDFRLVHGQGFSQVVVKQEITHRKPLLLAPEPVVIETWVAHLGNSSYTLRYRIIDEHGDVAAEASTVLAVVDQESGRPVRMAPELRAVLEPLRIQQ